MLGEKVGEGSGKVTAQRVLPNPGGPPKMETSFQGTGKLRGIEFAECASYCSTVRPDGTLFGEGQGILTGKDGNTATWTGSGVGTMKNDGSVSYRGAIYSQSTSPQWSRLNGIAQLFEYEVDSQGNTRSQIWEWK
jgi:hypothetical protein